MDLEGSYFVCVCLTVKEKPGNSLLQGARLSLKRKGAANGLSIISLI